MRSVRFTIVCVVNGVALRCNGCGPAVGNALQMCQVAAQSLATGSNYVEFMLHSSEFMPGGSPTFKEEAAIERLYHDLDVLFDGLQNQVIGMTLAHYYQYRLGQSGASV